VKGSPSAAVKLLPCDHELMGSSLVEMRRNAAYILHKTQNGQILPQTLHKRELRAPGCPFFGLEPVSVLIYIPVLGAKN
jgi:hypothetical protein